MRAAAALLPAAVAAGSPLARPPMRRPEAGQLMWVSTQNGTDDRLAPQAPLAFDVAPPPTAAEAAVVVDTATRFQTIEGFGGALTESAAYVLSSMSEATQREILDGYYGDEGHRYTLHRTHMGSCDFALEYYVYQESAIIAPPYSADDFNMTQFDMGHDEALLIPLLQRVKAISAAAGRPFKLVATPWTAPKWLKTCGELICPEVLCTLKDEEPGAPYRSAYALYFSKYLSGMEKAGVKPWAIAPQNEPLTCKPVVESMWFLAANERDFVQGQLGPRLRADHPDVKILVYDNNKGDLEKYASGVLDGSGGARNTAVDGYVDGIAFHWYDGDHFDAVSNVSAKYPDKLLLATEATAPREISAYPSGGSWAVGEHYGHDIIGDLNSGAQGWIDWNIMLDAQSGPTHADPTGIDQMCEGVVKCGSDAMIIADTAYPNKTRSQRYYPQAFYWYMGHVSRYVAPGSVRVGVAQQAGPPPPPQPTPPPAPPCSASDPGCCVKGENEYCAPTAPGGVCCSPMTCQMKKGKGKCQKCVTEGNTCKDSWELCCDGLACSSDKKKCVQAGPAPPAAAAAPRKTCSVSLQQQLSKKACTLGKSFDCNDDGTLFVKNGCRGIFYCDGVGGIKCEDQTLQSKATCACTLPELEVTAVHNPDDSVAVVVMNPSDVARRTAIYDKASGRRAPIEVPAHAIHTYWYSKE